MLQTQHPTLASLISQIERVNPLRTIREKSGKTTGRTLQELQQTRQQPKLSSQIMWDISSHTAAIKIAWDTSLSDISFYLDNTIDTQIPHHYQKTTLTVRKNKQVEIKFPVALQPFKKNLCPSTGPREILMNGTRHTLCIFGFAVLRNRQQKRI